MTLSLPEKASGMLLRTVDCKVSPSIRGGTPKGEDRITGHFCFQVPGFPVLEMLFPGELVISFKGELTLRHVFSF